MKKLLTVALLSVFLMGAAGQAKAASDNPWEPAVGPICVYLTNFCDRLEVNLDASANIYGRWDWTCDGVTLQPVIGLYDPPNATAGTYIAALGNLAVYFVFHLPSLTFDLWATDGVNPPFAFQLNSPFSYAFGPCGFAPDNGDNQLPSILDGMVNDAVGAPAQSE
jgi:hypothetical protein